MGVREVSEHECSEREQVESFECGVEPFVVSCETPEACGPGEASLNDPTAGQEHEASFCHGMFYAHQGGRSRGRNATARPSAPYSEPR